MNLLIAALFVLGPTWAATVNPVAGFAFAVIATLAVRDNLEHAERAQLGYMRLSNKIISLENDNRR